MRVTESKTIDTYYEALVNREERYTGIFFVGVKTTSVFCIPTCRARKPKKENVEFFTHFKDALHNGYRPCKICKPTENAHEMPGLVCRAIELVKDSPKQKVKDAHLREQDISPEVVRRWFKKHYGMTFQAFQRMYRVNNAFQELKAGNRTTSTAFKNGYESLSGFGYTYKKIMGESPVNSTAKNLILINRFTTPLGPMFVCATHQGVCLLEFVDRRMLETEFKDLQRLLCAKIIAGDNEHMECAKVQIGEYFSGVRSEFDFPLHTPGTEFQQSVWNALHDIPYGATATYQEQANRLNNPKGVRAVAAANGMNRVAIAIPCHRVIGSDGKLTGYAGGLERKKWLLDHEAVHSGQQLF